MKKLRKEGLQTSKKKQKSLYLIVLGTYGISGKYKTKKMGDIATYHSQGTHVESSSRTRRRPRNQEAGWGAKVISEAKPGISKGDT